MKQDLVLEDQARRTPSVAVGASTSAGLGLKATPAWGPSVLRVISLLLVAATALYRTTAVVRYSAVATLVALVCQRARMLYILYMPTKDTRLCGQSCSFALAIVIAAGA